MILSPSLPLFCLSLLLLEAQEDLLPLESEAIKEEEREVADSMRARIPAGAVLTNFSVPRFDENNRKTALLTAERMIVNSAELLEGENLKLWLYDEQEMIRTSASLAKARFFIEKEQIFGDGEIIIKDKNDQFYARSEGGIFDIATGQALMLGPTQTMLLGSTDERITMKPKTLLPLAVFVQLLVAAPPPEMTAEEAATFEKAVASPDVAETQGRGMNVDELATFEKAFAPLSAPEPQSQEALAEADQVNAGLDRRLAEFLATVGQSQLLLQVTAPAPAESDPEAAFEKLFEPHPDRVFITSSKGYYYDGTDYEWVFLGDIVLKGMGIKMTCNDNIKIIFDPPAEKLKTEKGEKEALGGLGKIGEMRQLTASGEIRVAGTVNGQPFFLRGDRALFNQVKNQLIIKGKELGMSLGGFGSRINDPNAYIAVDFNEDNTVSQINPSRGPWVLSAEFNKK